MPQPAKSTTTANSATDPTLYLFTSLTVGSSNVLTATSRLETILKANRIPFQAIDISSDERARALWGRFSKGKHLPGLVRYGAVLADIDDIKKWNEVNEVQSMLDAVTESLSRDSATDQVIGSTAITSHPATTAASITALSSVDCSTASSISPVSRHIQIEDPINTPPEVPDSDRLRSALKEAISEQAAVQAKENTRARLGLGPSPTSSTPKGTAPLQKSESYAPDLDDRPMSSTSASRNKDTPPAQQPQQQSQQHPK